MWRLFEDLDPTYSGYAWICFQNQYAEDKPWWPARMCRIWTHKTSKTKWWTGWDLESDEPLNINRSPCKVMIIYKPERPE